MIPFAERPERKVPEATMADVFEKLKTPFKYGSVMKFEDAYCDSPTVFAYRGKWYLSFIKIDKEYGASGYESYLAESEDLLHWKVLFRTAERGGTRWDARQIALYAAFVDSDFGGSYEIRKVNDQYQFSYLGGNLDGYETDPLQMGICRTEDLLSPESYRREGHPILSPFDPDVREPENKTLYKSYLFYDAPQTLGYPYVNFYNAKGQNDKESIFIAVSSDGEKWERYGDAPVISDDTPDQSIRINGDPQIIRIGDLYAAVYFVLQNGKTMDTFACSYDLIHWTKWKGEPLIRPEYEWENVYAHKPYIVVDKGIVYHFYCAVNDRNERFIAVATSEPIV